MKCPECVESGQKSTVHPGISMTTLMYFSPFYDAEGLLHRHDKNIVTTPYNCSNGHKWSTRGHSPCPNCSWPDDAASKGASKLAR